MDIKNTIISAEVVIESLITLLKNEGVDISSIQFSIGNKEKGTESADMSFESLIHLTLSWLNEAKAQAVPEWISVEDKLPEIGVYVMVFLEKQGHNPTTYNFCQYTKFGFHLSNVTHWAPLPEPPETQEPAND